MNPCHNKFLKFNPCGNNNNRQAVATFGSFNLESMVFKSGARPVACPVERQIADSNQFNAKSVATVVEGDTLIVLVGVFVLEKS